MVVKCIVAGCSQKRISNSSISFHKFPLDQKKLKLWLTAINLPKHALRPSSTICSKHFKANDYYSYGPQNKRLLQREAVPTLYISTKASINNSNTGKKKTGTTSLSKNVRKSNSVTTDVKQIKTETKTKQNQSETTKLNSRISNGTDNKMNNGLQKPFKTCINDTRKSIRKKNNAAVKKTIYSNKTDVKHNKELRNTQTSNVSLTNIKTGLSQTHSKSVKRKNPEDQGPVIKKVKTEICETVKKLKKKKITKPINNTLANENSPDSTNTISSVDQRYWTSIQETITEMQEKIKSLESKSVQDEKKIENFQKVLLQQKQEEIKALIEGKENELLLRMDVLCLDYNPKRICRLCLLEKGGPLISMFQPKRKSILIEKIKRWTGIEVEKADGMPSGICYECSIQMERADWFKKRSEKADVLLKKFIQMKKNANTMREICRTVPICEEESIAQNGCSYQIEQISGVKIEIEDVFSLKNTVEEPSFEVSVKEEIEDISCVEDSIFKPSDIFVITNKMNEIKRIKEIYKPKNKYCTKCNKPLYKCLYKKAHRIQCFECGKSFWDRKVLKKHRILRYECTVPLHKRTCTVCNMFFRWKWQLSIHSWQHYKVKCHSCMICEEQFTYLPQLKSHVATHFC